MRILAQSKAIGRIKTLKEAHLEYLGPSERMFHLYLTLVVYDSRVFHFDSPKSFYNLYSRQGQQQNELHEISDKVASSFFIIIHFLLARDGYGYAWRVSDYPLLQE